MRPAIALAKPGITGLIAITAAAGYLAAAGEIVDPLYFMEVLAATTLLSAGAATSNQIIERRYDALMKRTSKRPLVTGAASVRFAASYAAIMATTGGLISLLVLPRLSTVLLFTCYVAYIAYTLLKRQVWWSTLVGGIPGALPVLAGWTATGAAVSPTALALVAVMFIWQMPHFLSIGWLCRDDYRRAGFKVLSASDEDGSISARICLVYALVLIPVSFIPFMTGAVSVGYLLVAAICGGGFLWLAESFARTRTKGAARKLFFGSLSYIPLTFAALVLFRADSLFR